MQMTQIRAQRYCVHKAGRAKCSVTDVLNQALKVLPAVLTHTLHSQLCMLDWRYLVKVKPATEICHVRDS